MWFYVDYILVGYQASNAMAHDRPRGNLSDLYARWLGARELLLHHRNPYGDDITAEIQQGYYGRALDPSRLNDPKDQQAFAYPVYVIFLLAPLINLPFQQVHVIFRGLLIVLTTASVWWWLHALRWRLSVLGMAICMVLTLGSFPAVQGIKLQQLSLLVAALLAASAAYAATGFLAWSGVLLALATIKPQLTWPFAGWMLLWALSDWPRRRNFLFGFGSTMLLLLAGAEIVLPGWLSMFVRAIARYHHYTQNQSVLDQLVPWGPSGKILATGAVLATAFVLRHLRHQSATSIEFGSAIALVMALTVLVVPMYAPYNQVLLIPAILLLLRGRSAFLTRSRIRRWSCLLAAALVAWQWAASLSLSLVYLLASPKWALGAWRWPFFATFALPVWVFALVLFYVQGKREGVPAAQDSLRLAI